MIADKSLLLMWIVGALSLVVLIGMFARMKVGIGPFNLRVIVVVVVAVFSTLLALYDPQTLPAATGIYGTILGYVFGVKADVGSERSL